MIDWGPLCKYPPSAYNVMTIIGSGNVHMAPANVIVEATKFSGIIYKRGDYIGVVAPLYPSAEKSQIKVIASYDFSSEDFTRDFNRGEYTIINNPLYSSFLVPIEYENGKDIWLMFVSLFHSDDLLEVVMNYGTTLEIEATHE